MDAYLRKTLYITGIFRTGTTLLTAILNEHDNLVVAWQPYFHFFKMVRNLFYKNYVDKYFDEQSPMGIRTPEIFFPSIWNEVLSDVFLDNMHVSKLLLDIKNDLGQEPDKINQNLKPNSLIPLLTNIKQGLAGNVLLQLMEKLSELKIVDSEKNINDGDLICATKEVFIEEFITPLINLKTENAKIIHIIRDPRAIAASRNYGLYKYATEKCYPLEFIVKSWKRSIHYYLLNKDKEDYLMLTYESLVKYPEEIIRKISLFLNISFSEKMLHTTNYKDRQGNPWHSNSSFKKESSINESSVEIWKDKLSENEIVYIEQKCIEEMFLFGYKPFLADKKSKLRLKAQEVDSDKEILPWLLKYKTEYKVDD